MAKALNPPWEGGLSKKPLCGPYVHMPGQALREKSLRRKNNALNEISLEKFFGRAPSFGGPPATFEMGESRRRQVYFLPQRRRFGTPTGRHRHAGRQRNYPNGEASKRSNPTIGGSPFLSNPLGFDDVTLPETSASRRLMRVANGEYITGDIDDAYCRNSTMLETMLPRAQTHFTMPSSTFTTTKRFEPCTRVLFYDRPVSVHGLTHPFPLFAHLGESFGPLGESSGRLAWVEGQRKFAWVVIPVVNLKRSGFGWLPIKCRILGFIVMAWWSVTSLVHWPSTTSTEARLKPKTLTAASRPVVRWV
ncbi:MAG: hypothetical protein CM15mP78_11330 [Candidatus Poseidoniales archaeon]|nr:MAG: hypothetical protein CM15mP78_11330 [Candidatus Poseidoniales archaeon]